MLNDLLINSRSYRSFDMQHGPSEREVFEIAESVRLCPSTANLQALKFRLVTSPSECRAVLDNIKWAGYLPDEQIPPEGHLPTAFVVICLDKSISANEALFNKDTGITAQTMLLSACEMGYGGCMIGSFNSGEISAALAIPDNLQITLVVALGKPDEKAEITDTDNTHGIKYYRENGVHYVPKRPLTEIIIK